jgi:lipopolysaccharide export LptBFGC system permease protein LptF
LDLIILSLLSIETALSTFLSQKGNGKASKYSLSTILAQILLRIPNMVDIVLSSIIITSIT